MKKSKFSDSLPQEINEEYQKALKGAKEPCVITPERKKSIGKKRSHKVKP